MVALRFNPGPSCLMLNERTDDVLLAELNFPQLPHLVEVEFTEKWGSFLGRTSIHRNKNGSHGTAECLLVMGIKHFCKPSLVDSLQFISPLNPSRLDEPHIQCERIRA